MVIFVILCKAIKNEFATAHQVDFVYQKYKGMQAFEGAERRSVTANLNITPEQKLLRSAPIAIRYSVTLASVLSTPKLPPEAR